MKKTLLCLCCFFSCACYLHAQSLFGVTYRGGSDDGGSINKFIPATNDLTVERSFQRSGANPYYTNLTQATDGKLYGMTFNGGGSSGGVIFSCDPVSLLYTKLYDFDITNGSKPTGSMIQASDEKLYGMTSFGGAQNVGVIFSFDPVSLLYTKLYDFDITNGASPSGSFIQSADGKLYGMAAQGGSMNEGVIFSFDPATATYTKLKDFTGSDGIAPLGNLIQAANGMLYGTTADGGINQAGVLFSFNTSSSGFTKLKDFDSTNGYYPYGSLMQATDGKLYGMTYKGGSNNDGVIFSYDTASLVYTKLNDLDSANGSDPTGNLIQATDGKLYGMTSLGGTGNAGVIFSFDPVESVYTSLKNLDNNNGSGPLGSVMQATDGKLYGMTFQGGSSNDGVIFSFDASSLSYVKLKDFGTNINGRRPSGSLVVSTDGKLYGMTALGGTSNDGVIFSFDPNSSAYTKLIDFDSSNGANAYGSLIQATNGKLYGMTLRGGADNAGVIFSYDAVSSVYTKLKDLDSVNGGNPYGSLMQATDGKLYGMTSYGGSKTYGTIFSIDPASLVYTKLKDFDNTNGATPYGSLVQAANGKLYGMTFSGGNGDIIKGDTTGDGVIFSFDPVSSIYTNLKIFNYSDDGGFPTGSLFLASDSTFYGMTSAGGADGFGVIFSYNPTSAVFKNLIDFDNIKGASPYGNLTQAIDGKLYGMAFQGGSGNFGTIFSYDPVASAFTKLLDYNSGNGANPYYGSAFVDAASGTLPVTLLSFTGKNNGSNNELTWKVANEQQLSYYELQHSTDAQSFTGISQIKAVGNSDYSYNDNISADIASVYYYRLKSADKDGHFKYSNIVKLIRNSNGYFVLVNPNPFVNNLVITINSQVQDKATLILTDVSGRQLFREDIRLNAGTNVHGINETNRLPSGAYMLTVITSQQTQTIKVVKGN